MYKILSVNELIYLESLNYFAFPGFRYLLESLDKYTPKKDRLIEYDEGDCVSIPIKLISLFYPKVFLNFYLLIGFDFYQIVSWTQYRSIDLVDDIAR